MPSTRCWCSPCDDTSMATASTLRSAIRASKRCRSGASGVVIGSVSGSPSIRTPVVPITPGTWPLRRSTDSSRYVIVVFPLVPVTPTMAIRSPGRPKNAADTGPMASRTDGTRTWITSRGNHRSTTRATVPLPTASSAKSCPSWPDPGTQKNRLPGTASCERYTTSATSTDRSPWTSCRGSDTTRSASGRAGGRPSATKSSELIVRTPPRPATVIGRRSRGAEVAAPPPARSPDARSHTGPPAGTAGQRRSRRTRSLADPGWQRSRPWGRRPAGSR